MNKQNNGFHWFFGLIVITTGLLFFPLLARVEASGKQQGFFEKLLDRTSSSTLIEGESAIGTRDGNSQKLELIFEPEIEMKLPFRSRLKAIGRARGDFFDRLSPGEASQSTVSKLSRRQMLGNQTDVALREFTFEHRSNKTFVTIGKQQVVWGKADGLKVLDVVNPQDFREFILDDFEDARIPLWTLNIEVPISEIDVQILWIPDQSAHILPEADAAFSFTAPRFVPIAPPGIQVDLRSAERPTRFFSDSDSGLKLSTFWKGWDLTLNYLYHYDDFPILFQKMAISNGIPTVTIMPRYERTHLVGGTFSNAFGDLTIRGEAGFSFDRYFLTENLDDPDGVSKTDELAYVLGFDWYGLSETLISMQLFQTWLTRNPHGFIRDAVDTSITLLLRRTYLNEVLLTEVLWLNNLNDEDGLARPKLSYELSDALKIWTGFDLFYGAQDGLFGQFNQNDRFVFGFEWGI